MKVAAGMIRGRGTVDKKGKEMVGEEAVMRVLQVDGGTCIGGRLAVIGTPSGCLRLKVLQSCKYWRACQVLIQMLRERMLLTQSSGSSSLLSLLGMGLHQDRPSGP